MLPAVGPEVLFFHGKVLGDRLGVELQRLDDRTLGISLPLERLAKFPYVKTLETFDFAFQPSIDKKRIRELAECRFIPNGLIREPEVEENP
jgi:hypothetical protein